VHLVGFSIEIYYDALTYERQIWKTLPCTKKIIKTHQHIYSLTLVHSET